MSRLSRLFDKSNRTQPATSEEPNNSAWTQVGNAADHLLAELESLYWTGVTQELDCIVSTLRQWQQPQFQDIRPDANNTLVVNGFDTFTSNVIPQSSATPPRLASRESIARDVKARVVRSAQLRAMELVAAKSRTKMNLAVHKRLAQRPVETDTAKRRARLLLQASGIPGYREDHRAFARRKYTQPSHPTATIGQERLERVSGSHGPPLQ